MTEKKLNHYRSRSCKYKYTFETLQLSLKYLLKKRQQKHYQNH
jgi:hypothetical protein